MSMLQSVLRLKQFRRMQNMQDLAQSNVRLERCSLELAVAQHHEKEARTALWQTMTSDDVNVQLMSLARMQDAMARSVRERASAAHGTCAKESQALREKLQRLEAEIDKLTERVARLRLEHTYRRQQLEWSQIDESVANRHGVGR